MATQEVLMTSSIPLTPAQDESTLRKCLHLKLKFEKFGTSKKVKTSKIEKIAGETEENQTDKSMVRFSKQLLDSPELNAIKTADSELKKAIELRCLPFDTGMRLVPYKAVEEVTQLLRVHKAKRDIMVDSFIACYEAEKERARIRLGPLFDPRDYPPAEDVRREFGFTYEYVRYGAPDELKEINALIFAEERDKAAVALRSAAEEIKQMMRVTLADMVERLKVALTPTDDGKKRKLYDATVTNMQEWLSTFDLRNVTNDTELAALAQKARDLITGVNVESLRDTETLRVVVRKGMEEVSAKLEPLVVTRVRKMRLKEVSVQ